MAKVLILGGGSAAIAAAEEFARSKTASLDVTLVSAARTFTFYPAIVPYVFGKMGRESVGFDLPERLRSSAIRFVHGEAVSVDPNRRIAVVTGDDVEGLIHFDYALVALGRKPASEKIGGFSEYAHSLMTLDDADAFKAAVDSFQRGSIVVAMAPEASLPAPVCETAMALAERFASEIDKRAVSITAVFPAGLDEIFGASGLKTVLEGKGVEVVARFPVERIASHGIYSVTGNKIPFDLLMMIPPLRRQAAGLIVGQRGLSDPAAIVTDEFMQAAKFPFIYAAGEIASFPGLRSWYMSARQGRVAARNILARLAGTEAFVRYDHKAEWIATAGLDRPASPGWPGTEGYLAPAEPDRFEAAGRIRDEQVAASPMAGPPRPMPRASLI